MTCPDCERYKLSASMWRNKAYELGGTPLPWSADEQLLRKCLELMEDLNRTGDTQVFDMFAPPTIEALRERLNEQDRTV